MKDRLCAKKDCTGCLSCVTVCKKQAITVTKDYMGFFYPAIDDNKCISCNACVKTCPVTTPVETAAFLGKIYRYSGGEQMQLHSSSGGFIPLLIKACYEKGFYISGVVFSEDFLSTEFVVTRDTELISKMRKSKYVAADVKNVFSEIKELLKCGEKVLFVGLPCHVAALKKVTANDENLLTVDLFCHGNASPQYYRDGLKSFCKSRNIDVEKIKSIDFRPKPEKPGQHEFKMDFEEGTIQIPSDAFPYYYGFTSRLILRDSCYDCIYSGFERIGDISTGDSTFHNSPLGENIVIVGTEKGTRILAELQKYGGFTELKDGEIELLKKRFTLKGAPKYRKKIEKIKKYSKLEKSYLLSTFVPLKYKIKRIIVNRKEK